MRSIIECSKGDVVKIINLHAKGELKYKLISFGLTRGAKIEILRFSSKKSTVEVKVSTTMIALRFSEAALIEVDDE